MVPNPRIREGRRLQRGARLRRFGRPGIRGGGRERDEGRRLGGQVHRWRRRQRSRRLGGGRVGGLGGTSLRGCSLVAFVKGFCPFHFLGEVGNEPRGTKALFEFGASAWSAIVGKFVGI